MSDVLERLRALQKADELGIEPMTYVRDIWKCAADEIDRLRSEKRMTSTIDQDPLRYSPLEQAIEKVLFRRCLEKRIDGYTLETSVEIAHAVIDLLKGPPPPQPS
jgi:hypothetical protein